MHETIKKKVSLLSPRQRLISKYVSLGDSNKQIADRLFVVEKTIKWHLSIIYRTIFQDIDSSNYNKRVLLSNAYTTYQYAFDALPMEGESRPIYDAENSGLPEGIKLGDLDGY